MRKPEAASLTLVAILVTLEGRAEAPRGRAANRILASEAVIGEMHATRPAFTALTPAEQETVHLWLHAKCAVGSDDLRARFVKLGARTEAALVEAFQMGPPTAFLSEQSEVRREDHAAIHASLAGDEDTFLTPDLRKRLAEVPEESYVKAGLDRAIADYRIAALEGLALVGSRTMRAWFERAAPKLEDPDLRRAAERTLAALRDRPRR